MIRKTFAIWMLSAACVHGQAFAPFGEEYDESSVAITGGTIDGTAIGGTTAAAGAFTNATLGGNVTLYGDSANVLSLRNGTTAQSVFVYNTDSGANDEYFAITWGSSVCYLTTVKQGSGTKRPLVLDGGTSLQLKVNDSTTAGWYIQQNGYLFPLANGTLDIGHAGGRVKDIYLADELSYLSGTEVVGNGDGGLIVRNAANTARLTVDSSGNATTAGSVTSGGDVSAAAASALRFASRTKLTAASDGALTVADSTDNPTLTVSDTGNVAAIGELSAGTFIVRGVTAGITASTTQTQGQQPLTRQINEVATCATANDVVTMPTAAAGREITIINNGAQTLQIFPATGDDLGAGVNTSVTLAAGSNVTYVAYNATNWEAK